MTKMQKKNYKRQGVIGVKFPTDEFYHKIFTTSDIVNRHANLKRQYKGCLIKRFEEFEKKITKTKLTELKKEYEKKYCKPEIKYNDKDVNYLHKLVRARKTQLIIKYLSKYIVIHPITKKYTYHNIYYNRTNRKFYKQVFDSDKKPIHFDKFYSENGEELSIEEVVSIVQIIRNLKRRYTQMNRMLNSGNYIYDEELDKFIKIKITNKTNNSINDNRGAIVTGNNNNTTNTTTINNYYSDTLADKLLIVLSELFNIDKNKIKDAIIPFDEKTLRQSTRDILKANNLEVLKIC